LFVFFLSADKHSPAKSHASRVSLTHLQLTHTSPPAKVLSDAFLFFGTSY